MRARDFILNSLSSAGQTYRWVHGGGVGVDLPVEVVFAFSTLPLGELVALFADPFHQFGVLEDLGEEGSAEILFLGLGLLGFRISFRIPLSPLDYLDVVERTEGRQRVLEVDIVGQLEALEAFELAQVGAIGAFEAGVVALVERGLLFGVGMVEGVLAEGVFEQGVFEFEDALHVPGGDEDAAVGELLEETGGSEGEAEMSLEGLELGAVGFGDDRLHAGEPVTHRVAGGVGLPFRSFRTRVIRHCQNPFQQNERGPGCLASLRRQDTLVLSVWESIMAGYRMSREKGVVNE